MPAQRLKPLASLFTILCLLLLPASAHAAGPLIADGGFGGGAVDPLFLVAAGAAILAAAAAGLGRRSNDGE